MSNVKVTKSPAPATVRASEGAALRPFGSFFPFPDFGFFRLSPFSVFDDFNRDMDRLFHVSGNGTFLPAVECKVAEGKTVVTAELPGMKPEDVKVEVLDNVITIHGEKKAETRDEKEGYLRSERRYGSFYRSMPLPAGAKTEEIKAEISDGVLTVTIPAAVMPPPGAKEIPVSAAK